MASYTISVNVSGWEGAIGPLLDRLQHLDSLLDSLADDIVFPILDRHYDLSGLRVRSGVLKTAITKRGAFGNVFSKHGGKLVVGVDYAQIPYARFVIEGTQPHDIPGAFGDAHSGKGGRFGGHFHPGIAPHPIYFLTPDELVEIEHALMQRVIGDA